MAAEDQVAIIPKDDNNQQGQEAATTNNPNINKKEDECVKMLRDGAEKVVEWITALLAFLWAGMQTLWTKAKPLMGEFWTAKVLRFLLLQPVTFLVGAIIYAIFYDFIYYGLRHFMWYRGGIFKSWLFVNIVVGVFFFNLIRLKKFEAFAQDIGKGKKSFLFLTGVIMTALGIFQTGAISYVSGWYNTRWGMNYICLASLPTVLFGFLHALNAIWPLRTLSTLLSLGYFGNVFGNFCLSVMSLNGEMFRRSDAGSGYTNRMDFTRARSYNTEVGEVAHWEWQSTLTITLAITYLIICMWSGVLALVHFNLTYDTGIPDWMRKKKVIKVKHNPNYAAGIIGVAVFLFTFPAIICMTWTLLVQFSSANFTDEYGNSDKPLAIFSFGAIAGMMTLISFLAITSKKGMSGKNLIFSLASLAAAAALIAGIIFTHQLQDRMELKDMKGYADQRIMCLERKTPPKREEERTYRRYNDYGYNRISTTSTTTTTTTTTVNLTPTVVKISDRIQLVEVISKEIVGGNGFECFEAIEDYSFICDGMVDIITTQDITNAAWKIDEYPVDISGFKNISRSSNYVDWDRTRIPVFKEDVAIDEAFCPYRYKQALTLTQSTLALLLVMTVLLAVISVRTMYVDKGKEEAEEEGKPKSVYSIPEDKMHPLTAGSVA